MPLNVARAWWRRKDAVNHCHCEEHLRRSNPYLLCGAMDCFASLAMTGRELRSTHRTRAASRRSQAKTSDLTKANQPDGQIISDLRKLCQAIAHLGSRPGRQKGSSVVQPQLNAFRSFCAISSKAGLCFTSRLVRFRPDITPAASLPRWLSAMKLSTIGSSSLQNIRL
jgi:hypothetical protein